MHDEAEGEEFNYENIERVADLYDSDEPISFSDFSLAKPVSLDDLKADISHKTEDEIFSSIPSVFWKIKDNNMSLIEFILWVKEASEQLKGKPS